MRLLIPLMNTLNFVAIFLILYFVGTVTSTTLIIGIVTGLIIGLIIELVFHHSTKPKHKRRIPSKVSTKLIILPSALLLVMIIVGGLYLSGHSPFELAGQTTKDEIIEEQVEEEIDEIVEEIPEEPPEPEYTGHCEEKELEKACKTIEGQNLCAHEEVWTRIGYKCNTIEDCINKLDDDSGISYDPEDIRCNLE